ncbi:chlorohydrolase [Streptococcus pneumoniae]|nr:chlorohydrolase [Streptococcus pneumoniae]
MKIKEQTRKLTAGCSKHCFEVVDETDEVSSKHGFEVVDETDEVSSKHRFEVADRTDEVSNIYTPQLCTPNLKTIQNPCLSLDPG